MKPFLSLWCLLSSFLLVLSCQSRKAVIPAETIGEWKLVKVTSTGLMPEKTRPSLPYQETYEFKSDSTFRRYRSNGYQATGTYSLRRYSEDDHGIVATFKDKALSYHDLPPYGKVYSYEKGQVYLRQTDLNALVESYMASDGPAFYYQKVRE